jgi:hypothetical protein
MSLLPASGEFLFGFPSPRHLSSSGSYPSDLSGLGDPTGSNAAAGLALRVTGTHKPLYHGKVKIPTKGRFVYLHKYYRMEIYCHISSGRQRDTSEIHIHADTLLLTVDKPTTHCSNTDDTTERCLSMGTSM